MRPVGSLALIRCGDKGVRISGVGVWIKDGMRITYIGGPTVLIEFGGIRFLTDPTFDEGGGDYTTGPVTLHKLDGPAISAESLGKIDYVLLSHDHHSDNLDRKGRQILARAKRVFTTPEGSERLGGNAVGLKDWDSIDLRSSDGTAVRVVATPARHGPEGMNRGPVIGFVSQFVDDATKTVYIAGDTVWYEGVEEVARRFPVRVALLHLGAARLKEVGPFHLTMTAEEAVAAARAFPQATIVPVHFEGWAHFSEGAGEIARAFAAAGLESRLQWLKAGVPVTIE